MADFGKIGMNAMVVQFDREIFGQDADQFRPESWLVGDQKYRATERAMLVFGAGTRTCIGKHVSLGLFYILHGSANICKAFFYRNV